MRARRIAGVLLVLAMLLAAGLLLQSQVRDDAGRAEPPSDGDATGDAAGGAPRETSDGAPRDESDDAAASPDAMKPAPRARARAAASSDARSVPEDAVHSPPGYVIGTVVGSEAGEPVAGATVRWWVGPPASSVVEEAEPVFATGDFDAPPTGSATTGGDGLFEFPVDAAHRWQVLVAAEGRPGAGDSGRGPEDIRVVLSAQSPARFAVFEEGSLRPVPGAVLRVFSEEAVRVPVATVVADAAGRGEVPLRAGVVLTSAAGLASSIDRLRGEDELEIVLPPAAEVAGEVVDTAGRPVRGAQVLCAGFARGEWWPLVGATAGDGRFVFTVPADGEISELHAEAEGFAPASAEASPGESRVRIVLPRAAWIEGVAMDSRGERLTDFTVDDGRVVGPGRFEVGPLPPGLHEVEVNADLEGAKAWGSTLVALREGERRTGVRVEVSESGPRSVVFAKAVDPSGAAVGGVRVRWRDLDWTAKRTDPEGLATIAVPDVPGTPGTLVASPESAQPWVAARPVAAVSRSADEGEPVLVTVLPARRVDVVVVVPGDDGPPQSPQRLSVTAEYGARADGPHVMLADDARFTLTVEVQGRAPCTVERSAADVVDGLLTVRLPDGPRLRGRIAFDDERRPQGALVAATVTRAPGDTAGASVLLDRSGAFVLSGLPPGPGRLDVSSSDDRLERVEFTMTRADLDLGTIRIGALVPVRGVVVDDRGVGVPRASVRVGCEPRLWRSAETEAGGRFEIHVPAGLRLRVWAHRDDDLESLPVETESSADAAPVTLRLQRTAKVLVFASFAERNGVSVRGRLATGGEERELGRSTWGARPPAFGVDMPPGAWELRVTWDGREWRRSVSLGPGEVTELTLDE